MSKLLVYDCMFIICWHMNQYDSEAMRKLYSQSNETIAKQSTFSRLNDYFDDTEESIFIGELECIDYEKYSYFPTIIIMHFYIKD